MTLGRTFKLASITIALLFAENAAWSDVLPGAAMPETVSRNLHQQQIKPSPQVLPPVVQPKQEESVLGEQAKKIKFKLNGVVLEGNHIYSQEQLSVIYKDKLHQTISVADLFGIVQAITNYYRNNGYIISRAVLPPQHVKDGIVKVQIIEGYLDQVNVAGNPKGAKCLILAYGHKIRQCPPLEIKRMERYMLIANETPGVQVRAVLSPSKNKTGAADLTLLTETNLVSGYMSYDNYGTRYIGPQQITANLGLNSMMVPGDATALTITKTPRGGELTFVDLNYGFPIKDTGTRWLIGGTRTQTHPLFVLQPTQIDGLNTNYYTGISYPWIRTRSENLTFTAGFGYLDSNVTTFGQQLYTDHLRNADIGIAYNFADKYYGANLLGANFRQGLPILGYTSDYNPLTAQTSRPGGRGDYTKFTIVANRLQQIKGPFSAFGAIRGQWAFNPLLASEQFTWGGSQMGRGYDVAELIGDKGLGGTLELRYDWSIGSFYIQGLQLYTFYDAGEIWNLKTAAGTPDKLSGTSTGVGARFYMTKYISGNLMWTQTLTKQVAAEQLIGDGARPRVFFSIVASLN